VVTFLQPITLLFPETGTKRLRYCFYSWSTPLHLSTRVGVERGGRWRRKVWLRLQLQAQCKQVPGRRFANLQVLFKCQDVTNVNCFRGPRLLAARFTYSITDCTECVHSVLEHGSHFVQPPGKQEVSSEWAKCRYFYPNVAYSSVCSLTPSLRIDKQALRVW
jgi:hypothetical protein